MKLYVLMWYSIGIVLYCKMTLKYWYPQKLWVLFSFVMKRSLFRFSFFRYIIISGHDCLTYSKIMFGDRVTLKGPSSRFAIKGLTHHFWGDVSNGRRVVTVFIPMIMFEKSSEIFFAAESLSSAERFPTNYDGRKVRYGKS